MALESLATDWLSCHAEPVLDEKIVSAGLNLDTLMSRLLELKESAVDCSFQAEGAALFHVALANALANAAIRAANEHHVSAIALGGGCFLNRLLRTKIAQAVSEAGLEVLTPDELNVGDAGLALGQAWVAANVLQEAKAVENVS